MRLHIRLLVTAVLALISISLFYMSFNFDRLADNYGLLSVIAAALVLGLSAWTILRYAIVEMRRQSRNP